MELNWQKSQCVKVITADERTSSEVKVCNIFFFVKPYFHFYRSQLKKYMFGSSILTR